MCGGGGGAWFIRSFKNWESWHFWPRVLKSFGEFHDNGQQIICRSRNQIGKEMGGQAVDDNRKIQNVFNPSDLGQIVVPSATRSKSY